MNRDTEILKLQILADYYHSGFTSLASFIFGFAIAWFASIIALFFQNAIDVQTYIFGIIVGFIWLLGGLFFSFREYHKNFGRIDKLIQQVNRGEPLPPLRELRKKR